MQPHETFRQQVEREESERDVIDFLAPGLPAEMARARHRLEATVEQFYSTMRETFSRIAQQPQHRLEWAARCVNIPAPIIKRLIDDLGSEDIERLLVDIERGVAELRAAARAAVPKAAE
jgi:hypothetical protein